MIVWTWTTKNLTNWSLRIFFNVCLNSGMHLFDITLSMFVFEFVYVLHCAILILFFIDVRVWTWVCTWLYKFGITLTMFVFKLRYVLDPTSLILICWCSCLNSDMYLIVQVWYKFFDVRDWTWICTWLYNFDISLLMFVFELGYVLDCTSLI